MRRNVQLVAFVAAFLIYFGIVPVIGGPPKGIVITPQNATLLALVTFLYSVVTMLDGFALSKHIDTTGSYIRKVEQKILRGGPACDLGWENYLRSKTSGKPDPKIDNVDKGSNKKSVGAWFRRHGAFGFVATLNFINLIVQFSLWQCVGNDICMDAFVR